MLIVYKCYLYQTYLEIVLFHNFVPVSEINKSIFKTAN